MKKLLTLIFLIPGLVQGQVTSEQILGKWNLISESSYLSMNFIENGHVSITMGRKDGPLTAPLGSWSLKDGLLKINIGNKTMYEYKNISKQGIYFFVTKPSGVIEKPVGFHATP